MEVRNMRDEQCGNCMYFRQHYGIGKSDIYWINCGHCVNGRIKHRKPNAAACTKFVLAESTERTFANKEYKGYFV